jgi:hypothetical protein
MKKLVAAVTSFFLTLTIVPSWGSTDAFNFIGKVKTDEYMFSIGENFGLQVSTLAVQPVSVVGSAQRGVWIQCTSTKDPECDPKTGAGSRPGESGIVGEAVLDFCRTATQENCVEDLLISKNDGPFTSGKFLRNLLSNMSIPADKDLNYPGGSTALIWDDSTLGGPSATKYLVNAKYGLGMFGSGAGYEVNNVSFSIIPFREVTGSFSGPTIYPGRPSTQRVDWGSDGRYFLNENGSAGTQLDFDENLKFKLQIRMLNTVSGWFRGRLKDPIISIEKFSSTNNVVTIQGEPVKVPTMAYSTQRSQMTLRENQWLQNNGRSNDVSPQMSNGGDVFNYIDYFKPKVKDQAAGVNTYWTVETAAVGAENNCLDDKSRVVGIVTTNAMGYEGTSPRFSDGVLQYRVSGMHLMPDGKTPVLGTYDLVIRSDVARCLYRFSTAPISASVSITGGSDAIIATTVVNEKNGWLKLAAYGFTFSEKTLQVKLSQEVVVEPTPTPTATSTATTKPVVAKKITITCVKGKTSKKVIAVKPKCPTGFKKKN